MIWLTWRQHRRQVWFTLAALAALAALMVPTGLSMWGAFDDLKLGDCLARIATASADPAEGMSCSTALTNFRSSYQTMNLVGVLMLFLPLLIGLFWGAPLVAREIEHGTHRFAWTQGVSRRRWMLVKFGLVGAATLTASVAYGLGMSWWLTPLARAGQSRMNLVAFDMQGIVPIGYTLFAVALGVFAGTVWPKVLPAMAATLVGVIGLRIVLTTLARRHYQPAEAVTFPVVGATDSNPAAGDWVLGRGVRDASGRMVIPGIQVGCPSDAPGCAAELGLGDGAYNWLLLQPAERFWLFQTIEFGIYAALAVVLLALAMRRVRRIA